MEDELVNLVKKNETLVVIGETGSGKTTRKWTFDFSLFFLELLRRVLFSFSLNVMLRMMVYNKVTLTFGVQQNFPNFCTLRDFARVT